MVGKHKSITLREQFRNGYILRRKKLGCWGKKMNFLLECEKENTAKKLFLELRLVHAPDSSESEVRCVYQLPTLPPYSFPLSPLTLECLLFPQGNLTYEGTPELKEMQ